MGGGGGGGSLGTGAFWPTLPATVPVRKAANVVKVREAIRGGRMIDAKQKTKKQLSRNF